ncbi:hypothetical protein HHL21_09435 [Massilia sp. RP-1-19]|uniref:DUF2486 family protein n=1 Tax=Massilia polaris TaxID=2728846 RepID=A0A848HIQ8_9BURK|nr:hypothetical protein [Massilia polaris]NML61295.1 hypothetical protein [Massilia polaris]
MSNQVFDASIPVLTEVFEEKAEAEAPVQDTLHAELKQRAIEDWSEPEWTLLERRLTERILQQLQGRVDFVLEQRLKDSMEDVLRHAVAGLTAEIQQGLQDTIEKIVVRAVAQELAHLQALKK